MHHAPLVELGDGFAFGERRYRTESGARLMLFSEAYSEYTASTSMKDRASDACKHRWTYALDITADIVEAVDWHLAQGYGGPEFLFSKTGDFPRYIDSHVPPLKWCR